MIATYQLKPHELTEDFLKVLKETFHDRNVTITVEETLDETDFLLQPEANRNHLLAGVEAVKQGKFARTMTIEEAEALAT
jgi:hypothetical protein